MIVVGERDFHAEAANTLGLARHEFINSVREWRKRSFGKNVELCAIINIAQSPCNMDCQFCAQGTAHRVKNRKYYPLDWQALQAKIMELAKLPLRHIGLVATGKALSMGQLELLLHGLESLPASVLKRICLSIGHLPHAHMARLKETGIKRCHHNLETAQEYYPNICSTQTWEERRANVINIKEAGLEICSGVLFGLGESWQHRLALAQELKALDIKNIPLNFLEPIPGTPLAHRHLMKVEEALACIALFRSVLPEATLRICGGRSKVFAGHEDKLFLAGANALMTGDFLTTKGQLLREDLRLLEKCGCNLMQP